MALKTILIFLGKSSSSDKGFCSLEIDTTTSELEKEVPTCLSRRKMQREMAVSEKSDNGVFGRKAKQMQCVTNYRISTKDRHVHAQDHQDAIIEEGYWLGFSETR